MAADYHLSPSIAKSENITMRCLIFLALGLLAIVVQPACQPARANPFIHTDGTHFVDGAGQNFAIKGISLGNWLVQEGYMFKFERARSPKEIQAVIEHVVGPAEAQKFWQRFHDSYIAEADIQFLKAAGFNTVRVPLHYGLFVDDRDQFEGVGWGLLDRLIGWCRTAGIKVIIDLHAAPGGQTGVNHDDGSGFPLVFYVPAHRRLTIALWRRVAERYAAETAVLGYDLLNEPISPYNDEDTLNPRLEPLYADITAAIRQVDRNHVVFLAAAQWSTNFAVFGPPFDHNAAYTYHKFWASPIRKEVQSYLNFSNRYQVPLFLGETGELTDAWNAAFRGLNERFAIGWSFWSYKTLDSRSTVVSIPLPSGWEAIKRFGDHQPEAWDSLPTLSKVDGLVILHDYLTAIEFKNGHINASYITSLGLTVP